jgi:hypothetical protein
MILLGTAMADRALLNAACKIMGWDASPFSWWDSDQRSVGMAHNDILTADGLVAVEDRLLKNGFALHHQPTGYYWCERNTPNHWLNESRSTCALLALIALDKT